MTNTARRDQYLRRVWGMTVEEYRELLAYQNGVCAICKNPPGAKSFAVEHDHRTGRIRGLACSYCNQYVIGRHASGARLAAAAKYIDSGGPAQALWPGRLAP